MRALFCGRLAVAFLALQTLASAAVINVTPTRLMIVASGTSTDLSITNEGTQSVRFSVRAYRWHQNVDGTQSVEPTDDLIVFPQIVTLAPRARRAIRVGFTGARPVIETDYRIIATELPIVEDAPAAPGLTIRSKLSVPLFIAPEVARHDLQIDSAHATAGSLAFDVLERGTVYAFLSGVRVRGSNAAGATLFERSIEGWYLLPNQPRRFTVAISRTTCRRLTRLDVDAQFEGLAPLHARLVPDRSC